MICECDAPVPSHLRMSPDGDPQAPYARLSGTQPGVTEIRRKQGVHRIFSILPALSHERLTVNKSFHPAVGAAASPSVS